MNDQRGPIIAGIAGAVAILLVLIGLIFPKMSQVRRSEDALTAARAQQQSLQVRLSELKATEAQAEQIRIRLQELEAAVPPTADLPGLIRLLNDVSDQSAVDFMTLSPGQPTAVTSSASTLPAAIPSPVNSPAVRRAPALGGALPLGVSILPVTITVAGDYFAVDEYLFRLETLPRSSKVLSVSLAVGPGGLPELQLTITANFFTTDTSSGPGSLPGTQGAGAPNLNGPGASPTPSPSATGTPFPTLTFTTFSPTPSGTPTGTPSASPSPTG